MIYPFGLYGFQIGVILVGMMLAVSGIVLGLGFAFDDRKLKDFGRNELYQSIISGILLGSFLILFANNGLVSQLVNAVTISNGTSFSCQSFMQNNTVICFASNYLTGSTQYTFMGSRHSSLMSISTGFLTALVGLNAVLGVIAGIQIDLVIVSISFASLLAPFLHEISYGISGIVMIMVSISIQSALLAFVALTATTVILPVGLLLRTFYPTRKLGGFFIAVAIGLYVVFPLTYLFDASMMGQYSLGSNQTVISQITVSAQSVQGQYLGAIGTGKNGSSGIVGSIAASVSSLSSGISSALASFFNLISGLIVQVIILPVFSLIVTGISIKELSEVLGSEASFGKFKIL